MKFFNTAYIVLMPVLLLWQVFYPTKYTIINKNIKATINLLMMVFSIYLIHHVYEYYQIATIMGFEIFPDGKIVIGWQELRLILVVLLPFLFLFKKLQSNNWISLLLVLLLIYDGIAQLFHLSTTTSSYIAFTESNYLILSIQYLCWMSFMYATLWLLKRFNRFTSKY